MRAARDDHDCIFAGDDYFISDSAGTRLLAADKNHHVDGGLNVKRLEMP